MGSLGSARSGSSPLVPVLLPALERHGRLVISAEIRASPLAISPARMDRLLSEVRLIARGGCRRRAGFSSAVRRRFYCSARIAPWSPPPARFVSTADPPRHPLPEDAPLSVASSMRQRIQPVTFARISFPCRPTLLHKPTRPTRSKRRFLAHGAASHHTSDETRASLRSH